MLVELVMIMASAGVSAGAFAQAQRAEKLRDGFPEIRGTLRQLPPCAGAFGEPDPDADLLARLDAPTDDRETGDGQADVAAGDPVDADRCDRRGDRAVE